MPKSRFKQYVFDFEVYPNWWCSVFKTLDGECHVISSDTPNYINVLESIHKNNLLIGFNIKNYDLKILNAIVSGANPRDVYEVSASIINNTHNRYNNFYFWNKFSFTDLYDDWRFGSLKAFESNMGMSIVECSVPFDKKDLTENDKKEIIRYNDYDVDATIKLFIHRKSYVNSKAVLSKMFKIPLSKAYKSTNAKLAATILEAKRVNRPIDTKFVIPERVESYIRANLPEEVIDLFSELNDDKHIVELFNNIIVFGGGGTHSALEGLIYSRTDDEYVLRLIDVRSYYPHLMMLFGYMSRNVKDPSVFKYIYDLRVELRAKAKEEFKLNGKSELYISYDAQQQALKLILNTTYGAMKNEYNDLYDWHQGTSLCYLGQLLLTALANELYNKAGVTIIQTNTDGILIKMKREDESKVLNIVKNWEQLTGFSMDSEDLELFIQRDVNNYIEVSDGRITLKGKWTNQAQGREIEELNGKSMLSNLNAIIAHKAVLEYYINGTPVEDTINSCDDIFQFCFTTRTGRSYSKTYHYINDNPVRVNNVNRVVATTDTNYGTLRKYKLTDEGVDKYDKIAEIPDNCKLMNDDLHMIDDLDREWYIQFAKNKIKELKKI